MTEPAVGNRVFGEDPATEVSYDGTGQRFAHHTVANCKGRHCPIHRPSTHHMNMWKLHLRLDRLPLMERICRHGTGHPDPDCLAFLESLPDAENHAWGVHGCDGCCLGTDGHLGND